MSLYSLKHVLDLLVYSWWLGVYFLTGEELKRLEESYNDSQRKWIDDMITACQVSDVLQEKYPHTIYVPQ